MLLERLDAELQETGGIPLSHYEAMAQLSAAPGLRLRMRDLAERALVSRSRLTHTVDRLERAGLVSRQRCPTDRRGTYAVLTRAGRRTLVRAAPGYVAGVQRHFVSQASAPELRSLTTLCERMVRSLSDTGQAGGQQVG